MRILNLVFSPHAGMLIIAFVLTCFQTQSVFSKECRQYLNSPQSYVKPFQRQDFFQGLNEINSKTKYLNFLTLLNEPQQLAGLKEKALVRMLAKFEFISIQYLPVMNPSQIEFLLRLFVKANRRYLNEDFLKTLEASVTAQEDSLKAHQSAQFVYLFGRLGLRPTEAFLNLLASASIKVMNQFTAQNLSNSLFGFGLLNYKPNSEYFKKWFERFNEIQDEFTTQNLSNSIYSFYLLKEWSVVKLVLQTLDSSVWLSLNSVVERRIISQVYIYAKMVLNMDLLEIRRFEKDFYELNEKPEGEPSDLEQAYELRLSISDVEYEEEYKTTVGFYVDFYLPTQNKVVNVDGPSHFIKVFDGTSFSEVQRPQDHLIDDLLKAAGYNVLRIHYSKLN